MTLASQTARGFGGRTSSRGYVSRRRQRQRRRNTTVFALFMLAIVTLAWWATGWVAAPWKDNRAVTGPDGASGELALGNAGGENPDGATPIFNPGGEQGDSSDDSKRGAEPTRFVTGRPLPDVETERDAERESAVRDEIDRRAAELRGKPEPAPETPARRVESRPRVPGELTGRQQNTIKLADQAEREGRLAEARALLSKLIVDPNMGNEHKPVLRARTAAINESLLFSPAIDNEDPISRLIRVRPNDALSKIARRENLGTDWRAIQIVNHLSNPNSIREGQALKLVEGPFHVIVDKSEYRLDLFWGPKPVESESEAGLPPAPRSDWLYIRSFYVGLGEHGLTPIGRFIATSSKEANPSWRNPRTGEQYGRDDPQNPIGEFWLGIEGADGPSRVHQGLGLHGTIEPESIGRDESMGCIRMLPGEIDIVWALLTPQVSRVYVTP